MIKILATVENILKSTIKNEFVSKIKFVKKFEFFKPQNEMDCGASSLFMVANFYKKSISINEIRKAIVTSKQGVSLLDIGDAAEFIGFKSFGVKCTVDQLMKDATLPCILHWSQEHFVVLVPQNF